MIISFLAQMKIKNKKGENWNFVFKTDFEFPSVYIEILIYTVGCV